MVWRARRFPRPESDSHRTWPSKRYPWKVRGKFQPGNTFAKEIHIVQLQNAKTNVLFFTATLTTLAETHRRKWSHMGFTDEQFCQLFNSSSIRLKIGNYRSKWNPSNEPRVLKSHHHLHSGQQVLWRAFHMSRIWVRWKLRALVLALKHTVP